jgi:serine/threonine protein phosphatase PrpC
MLLPPPGQTAFRATHHLAGWQAWLLSEASPQRPRLEDSWRVAAGAHMAGSAWDAFAVFDGLGGRARGQEAAWAAASRLHEAMSRAHGPAALLAELHPLVRASGGAATAAVFLADRLGEEAWLLGVGDCSAYRLAGGEPASVLEHDRAGRNLVTDCLGVGFQKGRALPVQVAPGESLLLCTDGVEEAAGTAALSRCLDASADEVPGALADLLGAARRAGSVDDATALLVRRA